MADRAECLTRSGSLRHLVGDVNGRTVCGWGVAYRIEPGDTDWDDMPLHSRCVDPTRPPNQPRQPVPKPGRGVCPTCLTVRAVRIGGAIQTHNRPRKQRKPWETSCPGSSAQPLVGDRTIARAKALKEARDRLDFTLTAASEAYERARVAYDHTIRGARFDYDRQVQEIYGRYGADHEGAAKL